MRSHKEFKAELEEITDLGNGVTFAVLILKGRLIGSAGELEMRYAAVAIWTEGLVECEMGYPDIDQGRAAAERLAEERE